MTYRFVRYGCCPHCHLYRRLYQWSSYVGCTDYLDEVRRG